MERRQGRRKERGEVPGENEEFRTSRKKVGGFCLLSSVETSRAINDKPQETTDTRLAVGGGHKAGKQKDMEKGHKAQREDKAPGRRQTTPSERTVLNSKLGEKRGLWGLAPLDLLSPRKGNFSFLRRDVETRKWGEIWTDGSIRGHISE